MSANASLSDGHELRREILLQRVQPLMVGLIDGSLSTLAPIFSVALVSHHTFYAFVAGLATSIGAGISMAFSEGLSDTGELTGRGSPFVRGGITGIGTFIGGILHSLPFLIRDYHLAIVTALAVVAFELVALAVLRARFFSTSFATSLAAVSLAGAVIVAVSVVLGVTA
jgi:erythrin-vacuolar iron transport family protein